MIANASRGHKFPQNRSVLYEQAVEAVMKSAHQVLKGIAEACVCMGAGAGGGAGGADGAAAKALAAAAEAAGAVPHLQRDGDGRQGGGGGARWENVSGSHFAAEGGVLEKKEGGTMGRFGCLVGAAVERRDGVEQGVVEGSRNDKTFIIGLSTRDGHRGGEDFGLVR